MAQTTGCGTAAYRVTQESFEQWTHKPHLAERDDYISPGGKGGIWAGGGASVVVGELWPVRWVSGTGGAGEASGGWGAFRRAVMAQAARTGDPNANMQKITGTASSFTITPTTNRTISVRMCW